MTFSTRGLANALERKLHDTIGLETLTTLELETDGADLTLGFHQHRGVLGGIELEAHASG